MYTADNLSLLVEQAEEILGSRQFRLTLWLEWTLGLLAFLLNLELVPIMMTVRVFPFNLRILMVNLQLSIIWFAVGDVGKVGYFLLSRPSTMVVSSLTCRLIDLALIGLALSAMFCTLVALCLERIYAVVRYKTYDRSRPWLGVVLLVLIWLVVAAINVSFTRNIHADFETFVAVCESFMFFSNDARMPIVISYFSFEIIASVVSALTLVCSIHMRSGVLVNRAIYDLSSRFQIAQNVQVNRLIMPSVALHCCFHLPTYICIMFVFPNLPGDIGLGAKAGLMHINYLIRLLFSIAHPILAIGTNPNFKQRWRHTYSGRLVWKILSLFCVRETAVQELNGNHHFFYLEKMWSKR